MQCGGRERKNPPFVSYTKGGRSSAVPPFFAPPSRKGPFRVCAQQGISLRGNGRSRRSLAPKRRSGRSSKAIFGGVPAPLFSIPRLSGAVPAAYSPFHSSHFHYYNLHFTLFFRLVSTDTGKKVKRQEDLGGFAPSSPTRAPPCRGLGAEPQGLRIPLSIVRRRRFRARHG